MIVRHYRHNYVPDGKKGKKVIDQHTVIFLNMFSTFMSDPTSLPN